MLRKHPLAAILVIEAALVLATIWLLHVPHLGNWLQVHLGIVDEAGPYYGFWSGFGSDLGGDQCPRGDRHRGISTGEEVQLSPAGVLARREPSRRGRPIHAVLPASPRLSGPAAWRRADRAAAP